MLGWIGGALALGLGGLVANTHRTRRRVEAALPPTGRFVEADGHRFHVVERGEGPPVLLIHGLGGQHQHFYALMPELARDHRVIAFDRAGSGHTPRPKGAEAGPIAQARAVAALIDALELDRPLVVGHSLGGAIALALGLNHPDKVGGLCLVCPVTREPERTHAMFKPLILHSDALRHLIGWTVLVPATIARAEKSIAAAFAPETPPEGFRERAGGLLGLRPSAFRNASLDIVALPADLDRMVPRYPDLAVPAAILYGQGDELLDAEEQGRQTHEAAPNIAFGAIEGGHMIPITRPGEVADWAREREREWAPARALHETPA